MTKCIGREYDFRNCEEFGASGGYDEIEFRQIGKILKRKALVYHLVKATPATICGALLGAGISLASVGISALGLVEIGSAIDSTSVQLAAIVPLYLTALMGFGGALAGAAMTIDHLNKIFEDENVIVAPNNFLRSTVEPDYPYHTPRNLDGFEDVEQIGQAHQVVENPDLVLAHVEQHIRAAGRLYSEGTLVRVSK